MQDGLASSRNNISVLIRGGGHKRRPQTRPWGLFAPLFRHGDGLFLRGMRLAPLRL